MVEGPGVRLNAEKLQRSVLRGVVRAVSGRALNCSAASVLIGQVLHCVASLGKELFLFFQSQHIDSNETCLRLHFGMDGSLLIDRPHRYKNETCLEIAFDRSMVLVYDTRAEFRDPIESRQRVMEMRDHDVCSEEFNPTTTTSRLICRGGDQILADLLLDQSIFPGSGNIIKNEALHRAGLDPRVRGGELSEEAAARLVAEVRAFSMLFYDCRRRRRPLKAHCAVYCRRAW
mmetsp:Transcript_14709/g.40102  ORF Transcript_14709/g.40102 Transcript_14709/m.40102 type:complete len:231 (+) Transcript_14709:137-829(+)